jgi:Tfp pilus assembly protein PilV
MAFRRPKTLAAVTLIEVMAAIVMVSVAVLGASGYRYYSALDAKRANMQSTAARIALLLCENRPGGAVGLKGKVPLLCVGK